MAEKILRYDFDTLSADGSDNLTQTLRNLLNEYPFLSSRDIIEFQVLDTTKGIAMFPNPSVAILTEKEDVIGHVTQTCAYAFTVMVCRSNHLPRLSSHSLTFAFRLSDSPLAR